MMSEGPSALDVKAALEGVISEIAAHSGDTPLDQIYFLGCTTPSWNFIRSTRRSDLMDDEILSDLRQVAEKFLAEAPPRFSATGPTSIAMEASQSLLERLGVPEERGLLCHCIELDERSEWGRGSFVFAVGSRRSTSSFSPLILRRVWRSVQAELFALLEKDAGARAILLARASRTNSALASISEMCGADATILWRYDFEERSFSPQASSGVTSDLADVKVPQGLRDGQTRVGVVGHINPEDDLLLYSPIKTRQRKPRWDDWLPHDRALFRREGWQWCAAWPILETGRMVGAISCYSTKREMKMHIGTRNRATANLAFSGFLRSLELLERLTALENQFDEEIARSSISVLALGHIHDLLTHYALLDGAHAANSLSVAALNEATRGRRTDAISDSLAEIEGNQAGMERSLDFMADIIGRMRTLTGGTLDETDGRCDALEVARELSEIMKWQVRRSSDRRSKLTTEIQSGSAEIAMSKVDLERVLLNLVINASQWGSSVVRVSLKIDDRSLVIGVNDNGIGIEGPEEISRIFDRLHTNRSDGSGLGLYLVKKFAEDAGGRALAKSVPGWSTTVSVELPL